MSSTMAATNLSLASKNNDGNPVGQINVLIRRLQENQKRMKRVLNDLHGDSAIPRSHSNGTVYSSADTLANLGSLRSLTNQKASTPFNLTISTNGTRSAASENIESDRSAKIAATIEKINELRKAAKYGDFAPDEHLEEHTNSYTYPSHKRSIENLSKLEELDELENNFAGLRGVNGEPNSNANIDCTPFSVRAKREFVDRHTSEAEANLEQLRRAIMNENLEREMRTRYIDDLKTSVAPSLSTLRPHSRTRDDADLNRIVSRTLQDTANLTTSMYLSGSTDLGGAYHSEAMMGSVLDSAAALAKASRTDRARDRQRASATASTTLTNGGLDSGTGTSSFASARESRVRFSTAATHDAEVQLDRGSTSRKDTNGHYRSANARDSEDERDEEDRIEELTEQSPTYFRELSNFRYANRHDCFSNQSATGSFSVLSLNPLSPISERLKERLKTDSRKQPQVREQPIYSYRLNDRLFAVPINVFTEHRPKSSSKAKSNERPAQQHLVKVCIPENLLVKPNYGLLPEKSRPKDTAKTAASSVSSYDAVMRSPRSTTSSLNGSLSSFTGSKRSGSVSVASSNRPRSAINGSQNEIALRSHCDKRKVVPTKPRMENLLTHYRQQTKAALLNGGGPNASARGSMDRIAATFDGFNMLRNSASSADFARYVREQEELDGISSKSSISGAFDLPNSASALDLRSALSRNAK